MTKTTALEQELIILRPASGMRCNAETPKTVAELTAEGSVVVGASGAMALSPSSLAQMLESAEWDILKV